jgi:putative NADH-flavin reductase
VTIIIQGMLCEGRTMKIAVVGATGRTGRQVAEQALARGDDVIALARHPETLPRRPGLVSAAADVLDRAVLAELLAGTDAVVSALGIGASRQPTVVYSDGITNVLHAMDAHGIRKLAVISAVPAGPRAEQPFLQRHLIIPILERVFGATYDDMRRMEALLRGSDLDWVCLRPPRLVSKKPAGRYRLDATRPLPRAGSITCADLATALLDSLGRPDLYRRTAYVAN